MKVKSADADGKIFVTGLTSAKAFPPDQRLFVAGFCSTGVRESFLVTSFIVDRHEGGADVVLQGDDKIVATGFTQNPTDNFTQLAAARFLP